MLADDGDAFRLVEDARETGPFRWADLLRPEADAGDASYRLKGTPGWRLGFPAPPLPAVAAKLPAQRRYGGWIDRFGLWRSTAVLACVAALVVAGVLRTPALVARLVPASVDRELGDLMLGDFGRHGCAAPAGQAALAALRQRIDPGDPALELHVVAIPLVNAVTLPGGRIVIFSGLLRQARSPDEVAGVIGHELGHVRHRDVTAALIRELGLSVLLGGLEGHVGGYTNTLLATAYGRNAEAGADAYAIRALSAASISPLPTAAFFRRLGKGREGEERMFAYVASHPVSADRAHAFEASVAKGAAYRPSLDPAQWKALQAICAGQSEKIDWRF